LLTTTKIADSSDVTKTVTFDISGFDASDAMTLSFANQTNASPTLTVPDVGDAADTFTFVDTAQTLTNKTLSSPVLTTPQINDTSLDHQYIFNPSELTADRTVTLPLLTGNDEFTFNDHTQTLTNKTLTSPIVNQVLDSNSNEVVIFGSVGSAVNELTITNAATGNGPIISSTGETNSDINLQPAGTGNVKIDSDFVFDRVNDLTITPAAQTAAATATIPDLGDAADTFIFADVAQTMTNKTLTSAVLTTPQINDTSEDHQYVFAVSELTADRTVTLPLLTGNDEFTFNDHTQTLTNKTLTSPIVNQVLDSNSNEVVIFGSVGAAVNEITITNAATGNGPIISSSGETNSDINLQPAGTGNVKIDSDFVFDRANDLTISPAAQTAAATATIPDLGDSADTFIMADVAQTMTNKTITSPVINEILDANSNQVVSFNVTAAAVNEVCLANATTGGSPAVEVSGDDTNIDLTLRPKGSGKVVITADLDVQGTTTTIDSEVVNIGDNYLYLNKDYTTDAAKAGGIVVNYDPTATSGAVATGGFDTTSSVKVAEGTGIVANDLIQVSGANNAVNDGIYVVQSVTLSGGNPDTITINTSPAETEAFAQTAFTIDTTVQGTVTKVNVAVIRAGTDGVWEIASGSATGLSYADLLTASTADSVTTATVSTTDATVTQIATIATSNDTSYFITADIIARESDASDESGAYVLKAHYTNDGGVLTQIGGDDVLGFESTFGWNVATAVDGTSIDINVTGAAATNINWKAVYKSRTV